MMMVMVKRYGKISEDGGGGGVIVGVCEEEK